MNNEAPCGILVVDKPTGMTSHDVVNRVRRLYGTRQVGHTGTLDPLATGVLPVLCGRAVKASEYLTAHDKAYEARFRLGVVSRARSSSALVVVMIMPLRQRCKNQRHKILGLRAEPVEPAKLRDSRMHLALPP